MEDIRIRDKHPGSATLKFPNEHTKLESIPGVDPGGQSNSLLHHRADGPHIATHVPHRQPCTTLHEKQYLQQKISKMSSTNLRAISRTEACDVGPLLGKLFATYLSFFLLFIQPAGLGLYTFFLSHD